MELGILITVVSVWFASIEFRMRNMDSRLRQTQSKKEISDEIELRQESIKVLQTEIKEDIRNIMQKLDKILDQK